MIEVTIRASVDVADAIRFMGNDGVILALHSAVLLEWAEWEAGIDDEACFANLIEACYLTDLILTYTEAKALMSQEAERINNL